MQWTLGCGCTWNHTSRISFPGTSKWTMKHLQYYWRKHGRIFPLKNSQMSLGAFPWFCSSVLKTIEVTILWRRIEGSLWLLQEITMKRFWCWGVKWASQHSASWTASRNFSTNLYIQILVLACAALRTSLTARVTHYRCTSRPNMTQNWVKCSWVMLPIK